jgi:hypothetical protein
MAKSLKDVVKDVFTPNEAEAEETVAPTPTPERDPDIPESKQRHLR